MAKIKTSAFLFDADGKEFELRVGNPPINSDFFIYNDECYWWSSDYIVQPKLGAEQFLGQHEAYELYNQWKLVFGYYTEGKLFNGKNIRLRASNRLPQQRDIYGVAKFFPDADELWWNYTKIDIKSINNGVDPFIFVIAPDGRVARKEYVTSGNNFHADLAKSLGAYRSEDELDKRGYGFVRGIVDKTMFFAVPGVMAPFSEEQKASITQIASEIDLDQIETIMVEDANREYSKEDLFNMPKDEPLPEPEPEFEFDPGCYVRLNGEAAGIHFHGNDDDVFMIIEEKKDTREYVLADEQNTFTLPLEAQEIFEYEGYDFDRLQIYLSQKQASILSPVKTERDPVVWNGDILNEEVRQFCLQKTYNLLEAFADSEESDSLLLRAYLIGSITGYQYDEDADLDVNILFDLDKISQNLGVDKELLIYEMRRKVGEINGDLFPGTEHPCNLFLSTDEGYPPADGIYDLFTNKWLKEPGEPDPEHDPYSSLKESIDRAEEIAEKIDAKWGAVQRVYRELKRYPKSEVMIRRQLIRALKSLNRILENVVNERREIFNLAKEQNQEPPQTSTPNIVYKYLEYNGLLDVLHNAQKAFKEYSETGEFTHLASKVSRIHSNGQEYVFGTQGPPSKSEALKNDSRNFSTENESIT